jgi:NAD(P)-dependent dehydrogenase (short-subunit alcohol dehydrogenase family)
MTESAIAVTSGGTRGIDASFSEHLVGLGCRVAVRYRRGQKAAGAMSDRPGPSFTAVRCDVAGISVDKLIVDVTDEETLTESAGPRSAHTVATADTVTIAGDHYFFQHRTAVVLTDRSRRLAQTTGRAR